MKFTLIIDKEKDEEVLVTAHCPSALTAQLETLVLQHSGSDHVTAFGEGEILRLDFSQIECITVLDGKTYAIDNEGRRLRLKQRLFELEQMAPSYFIRINKSALANETHLVRFRAAFSGAVDAVFRCGYTEYVSRRCFSQIKRRFQSL